MIKDQLLAQYKEGFSNSYKCPKIPFASLYVVKVVKSLPLIVFSYKLGSHLLRVLEQSSIGYISGLCTLQGGSNLEIL